MNLARVGWPPRAATRRLATLGAARAAAALLGLAAVLIIARALSPVELGRWSLALAVQGYALHLSEFGLRAVVTTEAARAGRELPHLLSAYLRLRLLLAFVVLALVIAGCAWAAPAALPLVALATCSIVPIALQLDWIALVDDRAGLAALLLLVRPLAFVPLSLLGAAAAGPGGVAAAFLLAWLLAAVASWRALDRPAGGPPGMVPRPAIMLRRGAVLAVVTATNQLQLSADLLMVGWALGAAAAGDYYLAGQVLIAGLVLANAAGQIALARLPRLAAEPARFRAELGAELGGVVRWAVAGAAAAALLAPPLLPRLFGAEHAAAVPVLLLLLPWFVLQHATTLLQSALAAAGRETGVVRANLVGIAVLAPGLALAAAGGELAGFALARSVAEVARLIVLAGVVRARSG